MYCDKVQKRHLICVVPRNEASGVPSFAHSGFACPEFDVTLVQVKLEALLAKHAGQMGSTPQTLHTALLAAQALACPSQGFVFGSLDCSTAAQAAIDAIESISAHMETTSRQARLPDCHCAPGGVARGPWAGP